MAKIAVLGLGAMGSRMAARLIAAGHDLTVWNRSRAAADAFAGRAAVAATPRAAAAGADIVLTMLRDDDAARAVWLDPATGALAGMAPGAVAIDSSTVTPDWALALHAACAARGAACLDAPVSGSLPAVEAGLLVFLVGGTADALARAEPVLRDLGSTIQHVGAAGMGARIKLAINALLAVQVAAGAELLGMLGAQGLAADRAVDVIGAVAVTSPALKMYLAGMAAGRFTPAMFAVNMIDKDLGYVLGLGASLPVASAARDVFRQGVDRGLGAENMNAIVKLYD